MLYVTIIIIIMTFEIVAKHRILHTVYRHKLMIYLHIKFQVTKVAHYRY
jgi:hypothetical protein